MFESFSKMPLSRQILLGVIALTIALTFLLAVYFAFFREQYEPLYTNLRPAEAAAVVAELEERNVAYEFSDRETTILVPADELAATKIAIAGSNLSINGLVGFELFNESDMGLTEFAQKINYQRALQGELSRTIMLIDGIENARVHLALPPRTIFRKDRGVATAAVTIQPVPGKKPRKPTVRGIQKLVAAAVSDLSLANVSVIDEAGRLISDHSLIERPENTQISEKTATKKYYEVRIRDTINTQFPGRNPDISVTLSDIIQKAVQKPGPLGTISAQQIGETLPSDELRDFRVLAVVTFPVAPDSETKAAMTEAVAKAIEYDESLGDQVLLVTDPAIVTQPPQMSPATNSYQEPIVPQEQLAPFKLSPVKYWTIIALFALTLFVLVFAFLRKKPKRSTSPVNDYTSFAEQLQAKLDGLNESENGKL